jgi:GTP-binding protein Era
MGASPKRAGRVSIAGRPNVGKSTLLNALLGQRLAIVSPKPQTTRDRILGILTKGQVQMLLLDTPGIHAAKTRLGHRMNAVAKESIEGADVVVLVTEPEIGIKEVERCIVETAKGPIIGVINKIDLVKDKTKLLPLLSAMGEAHDFAAIVPISASKSDGLDRLLGEVERLLPESEHPYGADELTDRPVRFFVQEIVREQILRRAWQEVPHGVAVVVERFEDAGKIVRIQATIHVPKQGHKRILVGKGGSFLVTVGKGARQRCEALLGRKVHLELWVRVTPDWYDREDRLREIGYVKDA